MKISCKLACKEDVHICCTNFAKEMKQNLHETTSQRKTYGKRLFSKELEVWDGIPKCVKRYNFGSPFMKHLYAQSYTFDVLMQEPMWHVDIGRSVAWNNVKEVALEMCWCNACIQIGLWSHQILWNGCLRMVQKLPFRWYMSAFERGT